MHGSIIKGQLDKYGAANAFATVMGSPDFIKLAEGYGAAAWKVEDTETWSNALTQALEHDGPALIHIKFDPKDIAPYGNEKMQFRHNASHYQLLEKFYSGNLPLNIG